MKRPPDDRSQVGTTRFITRGGVDARTGVRLIGSGLATSRIASQVGSHLLVGDVRGKASGPWSAGTEEGGGEGGRERERKNVNSQ